MLTISRNHFKYFCSYIPFQSYSLAIFSVNQCHFNFEIIMSLFRCDHHLFRLVTLILNLVPALNLRSFNGDLVWAKASSIMVPNLDCRVGRSERSQPMFCQEILETRFDYWIVEILRVERYFSFTHKVICRFPLIATHTHSDLTML